MAISLYMAKHWRKATKYVALHENCKETEEFALDAKADKGDIPPHATRTIGGCSVKNEKLSAIKAGTGTLYIMGEATYGDVFGNSNKTQFRFLIGALEGEVDRPGLKVILLGCQSGHNCMMMNATIHSARTARHS
jgi:hypothetical protein